MKKRVLVTGAAGYIGSIVSRLLLEKGYQVSALDSLMFGGESIVELMNNSDFTFTKGDIRDEKVVEGAIKDCNSVVHLAAIVGDPACAKDPGLTNDVNLKASQRLFELAKEKGVNQFVFSSTCSNYGKMKDPSAYVSETSELAPVSLYAETKVAFEKFLLGQDKAGDILPTCLRFSTVYGLSPRPRFDLTVNEFTKDLAMKKELLIFGEQFWRPYCHVYDLARSVLAVLEAEDEKVAFEVFNVGNTNENYTKGMLIEEIEKVLGKQDIKYVEKNEDPRDYRVNFSKINEVLQFETLFTVPQGIEQIAFAVNSGMISNPDDEKYRNS